MKIIISSVALGALIASGAMAQSAPGMQTTTSTTSTMTAGAPQKTTTSTTTTTSGAPQQSATTSTVTHTHHTVRTTTHTTTRGPMGMSSKAKLAADVHRLRAILIDFTGANRTWSDATVKATANEANVLANRIVARSKTKAAINLRMHVRMMRKEAMAGNTAGAVQHANEALPFATTLADTLP